MSDIMRSASSTPGRYTWYATHNLHIGPLARKSMGIVTRNSMAFSDRLHSAAEDGAF